MNWESGIDIYILPCVKEMPTAGEKLLYSTGSSQLSALEVQNGRVWKGGSRRRGYMYTYS